MYSYQVEGLKHLPKDRGMQIFDLPLGGGKTVESIEEYLKTSANPSLVVIDSIAALHDAAEDRPVDVFALGLDFGWLFQAAPVVPVGPRSRPSALAERSI